MGRLRHQCEAAGHHPAPLACQPQQLNLGVGSAVTDRTGHLGWPGQHADHGLQQRRLARTGFAEQHHEFAGPQHQVDAAQYRVAAAGDRQAGERHDGIRWPGLAGGLRLGVRVRLLGGGRVGFADLVDDADQAQQHQRDSGGDDRPDLAAGQRGWGICQQGAQ